jgi:phosphoribosylaminoimidazolecarboxamide formyltransferase / IMP cyclohydrolase
MGDLPVKRARRALLSVTDKGRLDEIAAVLESYDYQLIASGGTARYLRDNGFRVTDVSEITGFPEIFGGRVKTLHPLVHGGILGKNLADFEAPAVAALGVEPIDVVVVNLYAFAAALAQGLPPPEMIEQIDVGGPTMVRAAAKNHRRVTVLTDPAQYEEFLHDIRAHGGETSEGFRRRLAAAAFRHTAAYDAAIADWFTAYAEADGTAPTTTVRLPLRYGENPHQKAWLELPAPAPGAGELSAVGLTLHGGKELSYNNLVDLVAALKLVSDHGESCCAVIKHTNPCGFGIGQPATALARALLCDPVSAFGGIYAFNREIDDACAAALAERFLELVVAPRFTDEALARLQKKKNLRVLSCALPVFAAATRGRSRVFGRVALHQEEDEGFPELTTWKVVAGAEPDAATRRALTLAWTVCKHGKSNAIVLASPEATLGCGFGQMSRVDSVKLAVRKAGEQGLDLAGCAAASDGFFPFPDGVEELARAGVRAVIAPGGSIRDDEVAAAAQALGVTLILTDRRHFNH